MPLTCTDILDPSFDSIGLDCSAIPLILDNLESISNAVCDLRCAANHYTTTSDCTLLPADFFDELFPDCDVLPNGATVAQICSCGQGGVKLWVYDEDTGDWVRLAKEFAVGGTSDFVDPDNPTALELLALFGDHIADDAVVIVRPTREQWFTSNCGVTWTLLQDVPPIGADVQNETWDVLYNQNGSVGFYTQIFDNTLYSTGDTASFPIASGDLIDITIVYGYSIITSDGVNPQDDANFRFRLSGPFAQLDTYLGAESSIQTIRNGLQYAEFNIKLRATAAGNVRLRLYQQISGNNNPANWAWEFYVFRSSVSVQRA